MEKIRCRNCGEAIEWDRRYRDWFTVRDSECTCRVGKSAGGCLHSDHHPETETDRVAKILTLYDSTP